MISIIFSCQKKEEKNIEKRDFIVSKFNDDAEKYFQEAKLKNPELSEIKVIKASDYPKGDINFIFLKNNSIYYYIEKSDKILCVWDSDKIRPIDRILSKDSLHQIKFQTIYSFLKKESIDKKIKENFQNMQHLSFSFENDTIKDYNIYKLLQDIDSLGYHLYTVRRIAPFEQKALKEYLK